MGANEIPGIEENKKYQESLSGTSRRSARAVDHDEYPRDFDPQIVCTVS